MTDWPAGWREIILRTSGVPVSQFALDVLSAWRKSTPMIPQTNNPLGLPAKGTRYPAWLGTPYALFPSMSVSASEFKRLTQGSKGNELRHVLRAGDSLSDAWRAIHGLNWPACMTETDYPSVLLDMLETAYRDKVATRSVRQRRTTGVVQAPADVHAAIRQQSRTLHYAASNMNDAVTAIRHIVKGLG